MACFHLLGNVMVFTHIFLYCHNNPPRQAWSYLSLTHKQKRATNPVSIPDCLNVLNSL